MRRIAEQLGVRHVLEGSVRREGDRVRVTAQLIDASTGFHAWTESYDRPWQDLVRIQQDISGAIAEQLHSVITPEIAQQLRRAPTADPRAYDFYLAGLSQLRRGGGMSHIAEAADLFRRSLDFDPAFARAQAGLCEVGIMQYQRTNATEYIHDAEAACRAALEADATLKETELALARLYVISGRHEQAEAVYRALLRRAPQDAEVHMGLGRALARTGRVEEAERSFREAILVEPGYWMAYNSLGTFLIERGRNPEAAEAFARVTELAPRNPFGFNNLGAARVAAGDLDGSARAFEQSIAIEPSRSAYSNVGTLYYFLGRLDEAVTMYSKGLEMVPEDYVLWGGRADTLWYLPQQRERARQDYRRAAALAERALEVDATDAETWAMLGFFYGRLGEQERSLRYVSRALELGPEMPYVHYYAAVSAADRGDREEAARLVQLALQYGYSDVLVRADPAFRNIPLG
jgi:tetratricopeptide (TPR) repeat protein